MELYQYFCKIVLHITCINILLQMCANVASAKHIGIRTTEDAALAALPKHCKENSSLCRKFTSLAAECKPLPTSNSEISNSKYVPLRGILSAGLQAMNNQLKVQNTISPESSSAIFILGNAGSGKTTLTQILAGNLNNLHATRTPRGSFVIIDDRSKIGGSSTVTPEYAVHLNSSVAFWDCPGFDDTRGPEADIAVVYFLRNALSMTKSAKFLFTVSYSSVTTGQDQSYFDTLVTHAVRMIKNVTKMRDSVGLVVTKVGNFDNTSSHWKSEEDTFAEIKEFLKTYVKTTENEIISQSDCAKNSELEKKVAFVRGVLGRNETGVASSRIFFIRSPSACGPLADVGLTMSTTTKLSNFYKNQLKYSQVTLEDFSFTLREETLLKMKTFFIPDIVLEISNLAFQTISHFKRSFEDSFYTQLLENPEKRMNLLDVTIKKLSLANDTQDTTFPISSRMKILQRMLPTRKTCTHLVEMQNYENMLTFLETITRQTYNPPQLPTLWERSLHIVMKYFEELQLFYEFCQLTKRELSKYSKQKTFSDLVKKDEHHFQFDNVLNFIQNYNLMDVPQRVHAFWTDSRPEDRMYLGNIVSQYIPKVKYICNKSSTNRSMNQVMISGRNVMLSDAMNKKYWPFGCTKNNVNEVLIVGMEIVYLDQNYNGRGKTIHLSIISPQWQLVNMPNQRRQILLNNVKPAGFRQKARNGMSWGEKGQDGMHGILGIDAGSFYGIFEHFENQHLLLISTIGGQGGDGQEGGNGHDGEPGNDAKMSDFPLFYFVNGLNIFQRGRILHGKLTTYCSKTEIFDDCWYTLSGRDGGTGGNGGNGGNGGAPGRAGHIEIIQIQRNNSQQIVSNINTISLPGQPGKPGKGGSSGKAGKSGRHISCRRNIEIPLLNIWSHCYISEHIEQDGKDGSTGFISEYDVSSQQSKFQLWRLVHEYKTQFLHDESQIKEDFISKLNHDSHVTKSMAPLAFGKELIAYEQNIASEINKTEVRLYYEIFLRRLEAYSMSVHGIKPAFQKNVALNAIYSAVYGKLAGLRGTTRKFKIINVNQYFDSLHMHLQTLKKSKREVVIQHESESFKDALNTKVEEANKFVIETVYSAIETAKMNVGELNNKLNRELAKFQKQGESDVISASKVKELYNKVLPLKIGLDFINFAGATCSLFGPKGKIPGQILSNLALLGRSFLPEIKPPQVHGLPQHFNQSLFKNNGDCSPSKMRNIDKESELWEKLVAKVDSDTLAQLKPFLDSRKESVEIYKQAIKNCSKNENLLNIAKLKLDMEKASSGFKAAVAKMVKDVEDHLPKDKNQANEEPTTSKITPKTPDVLKNCVKALNALEAATDLGMSIWNTSEEMEKFTGAIEEAEKNVKVVKAKRAQFIYEFMPQIESIENDIRKETSQLSGKSQVALTVKQWEIKGMLKKMRQHVRGFTAGMEITEEFQLAMDTLDEAFTLLVDLYEHIERYEERKQLADYIAKVNNANGELSKITDDELRGVLSRLNFYIDSNMFLQEYQSAVHAFKQWVFPFAAHYLNDQKSKNVTINLENTDQIAQFCVNEFEFLRMELAKYKTMTISNDNFLVKLIFTSDAVSSEPFFVWENKQWQNSIRRLLNGERVQLMANLDMRGLPSDVVKFFLNKSAIKFKTVVLSLNVKNDSRQWELNEKLNHFHLNMTHSGVSLYKVMGHQFVIFDSSQSYRYSFEKIGNNKHVSVGAGTDKINGPDVDFLMSPYTWWTFQLIDVKPGGLGFADLTEFYDQVDLHLEGEGVYLDEEHTPDSILDELDLAQHYEFYDLVDNAVDRSGSHECQNE